MPYALKADMLEEFDEQELIQLTDRAIPATGEIDDAILDRALTGASAEIDGYLVRYNGTVLTLPILTRYACDIARYRLYRSGAPEEIRNRYKDATRFLEMVAAGKISLGVSAETAASDSTIQFTTGQKVFAREDID